MNISLASAAVQAALRASWDEAITLNKKILEDDPTDVDALNRTAYAYFESGNTKKAQQFYRRVLRLDPYNPIALKNIKKISEFSSHKSTRPKTRSSTPMSIFLAEPGKTKVVGLVNIASKSVLSRLRPGDLLLFCPKKHTIAVLDCQKNYVGSLPDDLSYRLLKFIHGGNHYEAFVRSATKNSLFVFLREVSRSQRFKNIPSFVTRLENNYLKSPEKTTKGNLGISTVEEDTLFSPLDWRSEDIVEE